MMYEPEIEPAHTQTHSHTHTLHVFVSRIMRRELCSMVVCMLQVTQ